VRLPPGMAAPPLVADLFGPDYQTILVQYPIARNAGAEILRAVRLSGEDPEPFALEKFIREQYRDGTTDFDKQKFLALPYYLQHVLADVSRDYTSFPSNYDLLVATALRRARRTYFITLNYDLLFEKALTPLAPIRALEDYVRPDRPWSLIKLHGSVNWFYPINEEGLEEPYAAHPPLELEVRIDRSDIYFKPISADLQNMRRTNVERADMPTLGLYPALSVPVGESDERVCPSYHVESLLKGLRSSNAIDLLVIGYSGVDTEVISLIEEAKTPVKSLTVVDLDQGAAESSRRLAGALGPINSYAYDKGFTEFAQGAGLEEFFGRLT
jgi:hypothetical protein